MEKRSCIYCQCPLNGPLAAFLALLPPVILYTSHIPAEKCRSGGGESWPRSEHVTECPYETSGMPDCHKPHKQQQTVACSDHLEDVDLARRRWRCGRSALVLAQRRVASYHPTTTGPVLNGPWQRNSWLQAMLLSHQQLKCGRSQFPRFRPL